MGKLDQCSVNVANIGLILDKYWQYKYNIVKCCQRLDNIFCQCSINIICQYWAIIACKIVFRLLYILSVILEIIYQLDVKQMCNMFAEFSACHRRKLLSWQIVIKCCKTLKSFLSALRITVRRAFRV